VKEVWPEKICGLVEIGAAKEVSAGSADELAAAVFETRGAGGAKTGVMFGGERGDRAGCCCAVVCGGGRWG
jgi:hypothetical protein